MGFCFIILHFSHIIVRNLVILTFIFSQRIQNKSYKAGRTFLTSVAHSPSTLVTIGGLLSTMAGVPMIQRTLPSGQTQRVIGHTMPSLCQLDSHSVAVRNIKLLSLLCRQHHFKILSLQVPVLVCHLHQVRAAYLALVRPLWRAQARPSL